MVEEFKEYSMNVVGISETKWFGQDMYDVNGFLILHSGCFVPGNGEKVEGMRGRVLCWTLAWCMSCWKSCGEV